MARRKNVEASSLELLLDTICNTFGGIIFLAILMAILVQMAGPHARQSADAATQQELASLDARKTGIAAELDALRRVVEQQDRLVERLVKPEDREETERLLSFKRSKSGLTSAKLESLGEINSHEIEVGRIAQELASLDAARAQAEAQLSELETALRAELRSRTINTKLPKIQATDKRGVPICLAQDRLTVLIKPRAGLVYNDKEFDIRIDPMTGRRSIRPKSGAGTPLAADSRSRDAVVARLAGFNKDKDYLAIFVWPDSFDQFKELRGVMVDLGFSYRLVPMPPGQEWIQEGAPPAHVQ
jgi:hypothetical protein